ncbi:Psi-producing oxygenase A-like protein 2 [Elsinoe fawcettii]|nr:Psi-producing oxygenase A-like protein 2 [Elsinoe fawcettii]
MFSRNHNCIAGNLLSINEENKYGDWHSLANEKQIWQDNDIFQLARNINVGFFATVVLKDYVAAILNTPRADSTWSLDLGKEIKSHKQRVERGAGNVVSVEFAVLYHWHAALSAADANWMEDLIRSHLPHLESIDDMTPPMFGRVVAAENEKLKAVPPREWTFYNLKRGPNGRFDDIELSGLIKDCIEEPAHAFGPHGTPASLKVVDILGQLQAREIFNVCTLNEFRSYLNLRPYETFEEWCEDKDTARVAELLYSHIDNMELYPGLMAECTKPAMAGSGVCPGQTTGRGILDDAVALVRGDRFLSYDFNSTTLTNWGASKLGDLPGGAYGGMLPKLLFDGLPYSFTGTSTYALLPFYTPKAIRDILQKNNVLQMYDSARPIVDTRPSVVYTAEACRRLLTDRDHFSSLYVDSDLIESLFYEDRFEKHVFEFFDKTVVKNIKDNTLKYGGDRYAIDIVHHVANITPILWLADRYSLPVKCDSNPKGTFTANDVGRMLKTVAIYRNLNLDPSIEWKLREEAQTSEHILRQMFESLLKRHSNNRDLGKRSSLYGPSDSTTTGPEAERFYSALVATRRPYADLIEQCIGQASMLANMLTNQAALLVDLFLTPGYENYLCRMIELAKMDDDEMAVKELQGFVYEGMRHTGVNLAVTRVTSKDTIIQDRVQGPVELHEGQKVIAATAVAAMDPIAFSMPEELNPRRPQENYRSLLGSPLLRIAGPAIAAILKGIFRLKNVRRARGKLGQLCIVEKELIGINMRAYLDSNTKESLWPTNLMLEYEDGLHGGLY